MRYEEIKIFRERLDTQKSPSISLIKLSYKAVKNISNSLKFNLKYSVKISDQSPPVFFSNRFFLPAAADC